MTIRVAAVLLCVTAAELFALDDGRRLPVQTDATARVEAALRSNPAMAYQGMLRFTMEQSLSSGGTSGIDSKPRFIRQAWQIETDGAERIAGRIKYETGSNIESLVWFGENELSIWWTTGDSLIIFHKSFLSSDRSAEYQVEVSSIQQLIRQARQEIGNVLGSGRLAETSELKILKCRPKETGFDVELARSGIPGRLQMNDVNGDLVVTELKESYPEAEISWEFGDIRVVGGLSVPGTMTQASDYSDGRKYRFAYKDIQTRARDAAGVIPRRLLDPTADEDVLEGVFVLVTHELNDSKTEPVSK